MENDSGNVVNNKHVLSIQRYTYIRSLGKNQVEMKIYYLRNINWSDLEINSDQCLLVAIIKDKPR